MSEPFDFEAFIAGSHLAEDTFTMYLVDYGPQIARLDAQIDQAKSGPDDRESSTASAEVADLERQRDVLVAKMEESRREFTLRACTPDELKLITSDETDVYDQLAIQSVKPALDRDQWKRVGEAAGAIQFSEFVVKANALVTSKVVVPDFSQTSSTSRDLRESSLS